MSIIDKARVLAKQIRFEDDEHIPNTDIFRVGADMIDALCVELESKLAQPEQLEPVAWIEHHKAGDNLNWEQHAVSDTPLYTQPKAPEPLTDEDLNHIFFHSISPSWTKRDDVTVGVFRKFARAVLAAQGAKK